jgi:hypothetical protein
VRLSTRPLVTAAAALAVTVGLLMPGSSASGDSAAQVQPYLQQVLSSATAAQVLTVMVHADDITTARSAVSTSGLTLVTTFDKIGVAVAKGTPSRVADASAAPGVTYLEGNQPISFHAYRYVNGDAYSAVGPFSSSRDKGTGLVDVVAAARQLGAS